MITQCGCKKRSSWDHRASMDIKMNLSYVMNDKILFKKLSFKKLPPEIYFSFRIQSDTVTRNNIYCTRTLTSQMKGVGLNPMYIFFYIYTCIRIINLIIFKEMKIKSDVNYILFIFQTNNVFAVLSSLHHNEMCYMFTQTHIIWIVIKYWSK